MSRAYVEPRTHHEPRELAPGLNLGVETKLSRPWSWPPDIVAIWNDLLCVALDVKFYSIDTRSLRSDRTISSLRVL